MKNAVSPLTSTIILIVFAGLLGLVVISWGSSQVQIASCQDTSISVIQIHGQDDACFTTDSIEINLLNNGNINIDGVKVIFVGEELQQLEVQQSIAAGDAAHVSANTPVSGIKKVILMPKVGNELCSQKSVGVDDLNACN
ncbi:MAG TPA: hypothetical protein VJH97_00210 [Candidatus Nanoarchaeia archaeon]|nr:hypothetical protein [Candidatus Nanoarchaeia archaeon]